MDRFKGLKIGMQSFTLRGFNVDDAVGHLKALGVGYVEFFPRHMPMDNAEEADRVAALCKDNGITINSYGVLPFSADEADARAKFEFAKKYGVKVLSANPKPDAFDTLDKLCEEYQIKIAIHNHGPKSLWPDIDTIAKGIEGHSPLVGLCNDTGHFLRVPVDPMDVFNRFSDRIHSVHLKDIGEDRGDEHGQEYIVGDGPLDLKAVLGWLTSNSYAGPISLEYELNPENPIDDLKVALGRIEETLG